MGLLDDEDESRPPNSDDEEAVDNPDPVADETMGEFDRLLAEQVSLHQNNSVSVNSPRTPGATTPRTPAFPRPGQGASSTPVPVSTHFILLPMSAKSVYGQSDLIYWFVWQ